MGKRRNREITKHLLVTPNSNLGSEFEIQSLKTASKIELELLAPLGNGKQCQATWFDFPSRVKAAL